jgi:hypothetical protein
MGGTWRTGRQRVGGNGGVLQKFSHDLVWMKKGLLGARIDGFLTFVFPNNYIK